MREAPVGRVVGTERRPNTPHEFHFWTAEQSAVGIGALVRVDVGGPQPRRVYGVVVDGASYTDLETPLHDYIGLEGDPAMTVPAPTERPEIRLYTAAVLRHEPPEPLQPVSAGPVYLATDEDVRVALRMDAYAKPGGTAIPVGLYTTGGLEAPIYLDADFLLGPEAAHLNITGVSGLATKTSAVLFLLASIFEHLPPSKGSVAALCFNVKGPDLLFLDQPGELTEEDRRMYERLGVPPEPFKNVHYYAPYKPDGYNLNTLRTHEALTHNVSPLVWGLEQILKFAEVLLTREDVDAKADALIEFIRERVVGREMGPEQGVTRHHLVRTFQDLEDWFEDVLWTCEQNSRENWRTHHVATIRKVRNRLLNLSTRAKGLVSNDATVSDLPWGAFQDRHLYVIDVANVEPEAQDLIFARVVTEARERLERKALGVDHLIVFVDELNKYAPADGHDTYVRKMLLDVSERGRYLGLVLFGAQQFRSQVHKRVVGNAGTGLYGRMDMDELATPGYSVLSPATKSKLATLSKGELMVRHPHFTQPIFVRFPRPAALTGRQGVERFAPEADLPLEEAVVRQLRRLDRRIPVTEVKDLIAGRDEAEVLTALHRTQQVKPADVLAFFRSCLKKKVPRQVVPAGGAPHRGVPVVDDPYA
jgi:DNA helicase HerA-like ATPase|nr:MAG: ATP-binding protein [bacterium]